MLHLIYKQVKASKWLIALSFQVRLVVQLGAKQFLCSLCHKIFTSALVAKDHIRGVHDLGMPISCPICHKRFQTRRTRDRHRKNCSSTQSCAALPAERASPQLEESLVKNVQQFILDTADTKIANKFPGSHTKLASYFLDQCSSSQSCAALSTEEASHRLEE